MVKAYLKTGKHTKNKWCAMESFFARDCFTEKRVQPPFEGDIEFIFVSVEGFRYHQDVIKNVDEVVRELKAKEK